MEWSGEECSVVLVLIRRDKELPKMLCMHWERHMPSIGLLWADEMTKGIDILHTSKKKN